MSRLLWILQALLAAVFLFSASFKLLAPIDAIQAQLPLDATYIRAIGTIELLGALGLLLPSLLKILPFLTPLAAAGLVLLMTGATLLSPSLTGEPASAALPAALGIVSAFVAYGRARLAPIAPRRGEASHLYFAAR
jgi:DoxX-like protein